MIKSTMNLIVLLSMMLLPSACNDEMPDPNPTNDDEIVFFNGQIYTVNEAAPWADAILVKDGVIQYVGDEATAKSMASENASQRDLDGAFMMPGIHDVHMHPLEASTDNFQFVVTENVTDPEDYALDVEFANTETPGTSWLLGWGHDLEVLLEATRSPVEILDEVTTDRPVYLG